MTCDIQTQQLEIIVIAMRMVQMVGDWGCLWHLIRAWKILKYTLPFGKAAIPFCFCREHWMHVLVYDLVRRWLAWYLAIGQMSKKTYKGSGTIGQDLFWANMGKSDTRNPLKIFLENKINNRNRAEGSPIPCVIHTSY